LYTNLVTASLFFSFAARSGLNFSLTDLPVQHQNGNFPPLRIPPPWFALRIKVHGPFPPPFTSPSLLPPVDPEVRPSLSLSPKGDLFFFFEKEVPSKPSLPSSLVSFENGLSSPCHIMFFFPRFSRITQPCYILFFPLFVR